MATIATDRECVETDDGIQQKRLSATSVKDETVPNPADPAAPSVQVSSKRQSLSDIFTIFCAGFALISDGYQNSLMTMTNVVLKKEYKEQYTSYYSTQVSNALLVGEIFGQITIGLTCDYLGRKAAIVITTVMIVVGGILATASNGSVRLPIPATCATPSRRGFLTAILPDNHRHVLDAHRLQRYRRLRHRGRVSCQLDQRF